MKLDLPLDRLEDPLAIALRCEAIFQYWCRNNLALAFEDRLPSRVNWYLRNAPRLWGDYGIPILALEQPAGRAS